MPLDFSEPWPKTADQVLDRKGIQTLLLAGFPMLVFPKQIEKVYAARDAMEHIRFRRVALLAIICAYTLSGMADLLIDPDGATPFSLYRFFFIIPVCLGILVFSLWPMGMALFKNLFFWTFMLLVLGDAFRFADAKPPLHYVYFGSFIVYIVLMFGFRLAGFWQACMVTLFVHATYHSLLFIWPPIPWDILIYNEVLLGISTMVCVVMGYELEHRRRKNFLATHLLEMDKQGFEELARRDGMTGLANRRYFDNALQKEWNRAMRTSSPICLVLIDVDHFKDYNDRYGHQMGDETLVAIAAVIMRYARRAGELAARIGGEEFAIIAPNVNVADAAVLAEALRSRIHQRRIIHEASSINSFVTISIGVASVSPWPGLSQESFIKAADEALYRAKQGGRNKVEIANLPMQKLSSAIGSGR